MEDRSASWTLRILTGSSSSLVRKTATLSPALKFRTRRMISDERGKITHQESLKSTRILSPWILNRQNSPQASSSWSSSRGLFSLEEGRVCLRTGAFRGPGAARFEAVDCFSKQKKTHAEKKSVGEQANLLNTLCVSHSSCLKACGWVLHLR
jgi:hypothetical protein